MARWGCKKSFNHSAGGVRNMESVPPRAGSTMRRSNLRDVALFRLGVKCPAPSLLAVGAYSLRPGRLRIG